MAIEQYQKIYLYKGLVHAKLFIDNHYGKDIDLNNIADQAHFPNSILSEHLKVFYGKTSHHYLTEVRINATEVRINAAKELLKKSISIKRNLFPSGFDSTTSFAGHFKKSVGLSPLAFRHPG